MKRSADQSFVSSQEQQLKRMKLNFDDGFLADPDDLISDTDEETACSNFLISDHVERQILRPKRRFPDRKTASVTPHAAIFLQLISLSQFTSSFLSSGAFQASRLSYHDRSYKRILEYVRNSQPHNFKVELISLLQITQPTIKKVTQINQQFSFSMMLWHGTKPNSVAPILRDGFKCPKPSGQMFGQGIYFADRISKSAQYCNQDVYCGQPKKGDVGYIFLCEVSLEPTNPMPQEPQVQTVNLNSLMCSGKYVPDRFKIMDDGVIWPMGSTIRNREFKKYELVYNEYVVYSPDKVKIKYLAKVQFS